MYTRTGNNSFREFEERVPALRSAGRLAVEAPAFVRGLGPQDYPILEDDTTAVLLYHGNAVSVGLLGDMTGLLLGSAGGFIKFFRTVSQLDHKDRPSLRNGAA